MLIELRKSLGITRDESKDLCARWMTEAWGVPEAEARAQVELADASDLLESDGPLSLTDDEAAAVVDRLDR